MMDVDEAAERLGFPAGARAWLNGLPVPADVQLPANPQALLDFCGVADNDQREMLAARPDPEAHPEWWAVVSAMAASLEQNLDKPIPSTGFQGWPVVPAASSPVGLFAAAWALLSALPRLLDRHERRGVPDAVSRATASALGGVMGTHRHLTGRPGVGLMPLWGPPLRFRGADFEIGRHSFTRAELGLGDGVAGHVLMIHVPPIGPLDPSSSERSVAEAARLFDQCYPDEPVTAFVCNSWLLDPQLAEYLPEDCNIRRFQRRFDVLPLLPPQDPYDDDRDMMRIGLHLSPPTGPFTAEDLERVPQKTTLQRAFVAHLRTGRHWQKRTGILRSDEALTSWPATDARARPAGRTA
ncbi:acyltransferase domain-containing protein [Kribbella sp. ALI-6-A]|uniref:acyltransferase domain-containing protein n=1 Tax=Kribbella sp. ALI-6-A TaxID=1933817 RepID=UPI00117A5A1D|nr:acyltransferase domain-containing protein [Kribbella sp. ALI-6-A]